MPSPMMKLSKDEEMVARIMMAQGYQLGRGLGKVGQGILAPIQLKENKDRFGLGYCPTEAEKRKVAEGTRGERLAKLRGQDPEPKRIHLCDIHQNFRSTGLLDPNQITAIEDGSKDEESGVNLVRRCRTEEELKNWEAVDLPITFNSK